MRKFRFIAPVIAGVLALAACTPSGDNPSGGSGGGELAAGDGTIEITSLWGGAEAEAFQAVLDDFMASHEGITVEYTSQREEYATVLNNRIAQNDAPDIAIIPGIGFLRSFARDDLLIPLADLGIDASSIEGNYASGILDVGTVNGELLALMVKLNSKGTIWYKPATFEDNGYEVPTSWDDLLALTDQMKADGLGPPWAVGAGDSWNLTDIFEMLYLTMAGEDAYDTLFSADGNWTDQTVLDAAAAMTDLYTDDNIVGGIDGALATKFTDAIGQIYAENGDAQLFYEGGFVAGLTKDVNDSLVQGEDMDFFDFPPGGKITIGGDVIAAFHADADVAAFMEYMTTPESGTTWAEGGTIISPIKGVDTSVYEDVGPMAVKEAEQVTGADVVRFDGSDLLPAGPDLGATLQAILQDPSSAQSQFETFQGQVDQAWTDEAG
jgi:ABC-type glycerol-3-phosphate transport system substrate-binding protein